VGAAAAIDDVAARAVAATFGDADSVLAWASEVGDSSAAVWGDGWNVPADPEPPSPAVSCDDFDPDVDVAAAVADESPWEDFVSDFCASTTGSASAATSELVWTPPVETTTPGAPAGAPGSEDVVVALVFDGVVVVVVVAARAVSDEAAEEPSDPPVAPGDPVGSGSVDDGEVADGPVVVDAPAMDDPPAESAGSEAESAHAMPHPDAIAAPMPRATANPPTRPT